MCYNLEVFEPRIVAGIQISILLPKAVQRAKALRKIFICI